MMAKVIVKNGAVEIQSDKGSLISRIDHDNVIQADVNRTCSKVLLTLANGRVEVRSVEGMLLYTLGVLKAAAARFVGDGILVRFP